MLYGMLKQDNTFLKNWHYVNFLKNGTLLVGRCSTATMFGGMSGHTQLVCTGLLFIKKSQHNGEQFNLPLLSSRGGGVEGVGGGRLHNLGSYFVVTYRSRPADILIPNWSLSRSAAFDVKVIHPLNNSDIDFRCWSDLRCLSCSG